jgi:HEAT repeat protein
MSEEVRATIMSSIRLKCKDETVISEINKILAQKSPPAQILIEALRVGNWYTDKLNQENLFKHTESNDPKVREMAAYALDCSTNPKAMAPLFKLTEDPVPGVRAQAAATLGRFFIQAKPEKDKIYKKLLSMLEDKNPDVRYDAVNALRNFGDKKAISNLIKLQEHEKDNSVLRIIKRTIRELKDFH